MCGTLQVLIAKRLVVPPRSGDPLPGYGLLLGLLAPAQRLTNVVPAACLDPANDNLSDTSRYIHYITAARICIVN